VSTYFTVPSWLARHADLAASWEVRRRQISRSNCKGCAENDQLTLLDAEFMRKVEQRDKKDAANRRLQNPR